MMRTTSVMAAVLAALLFALPARAQEKCMLNYLTSVDMNVDDTGRINIPVDVDGHGRRLMVDTGAPTSLLSDDVVTELNLPTHKAKATFLTGWGGRRMDQIANVKQLAIGDLKTSDFALYVHDGLGGTDGLVGLNLQVRFDLDFDFAKGKLTYFAQDHCPGKVVYWTQHGYGAIPFKWLDGHIMVPVDLDGQQVYAIIDTGAHLTTMSLEKASRMFGRDKAELAKNRYQTFKSLTLGSVQVVNPVVEVVPDSESRLMTAQFGVQMNMIIGMTTLRQLHMYIAFGEQVIYVTPATQYK